MPDPIDLHWWLERAQAGQFGRLLTDKAIGITDLWLADQQDLEKWGIESPDDRSRILAVRDALDSAELLDIAEMFYSRSENNDSGTDNLDERAADISQAVEISQVVAEDGYWGCLPTLERFYRSYGEILAEQEYYDAAYEWLDRARVISEALVVAWPNNMQFLYNRFLAFQAIANTALEDGTTGVSKARALCSSAFEAGIHLLDAEPEWRTQEEQIDFLKEHLELGSFLCDVWIAPDNHEIQATLLQARAVAYGLLELDPEDEKVRHEIRKLEHRLGDKIKDEDGNPLPDIDEAEHAGSTVEPVRREIEDGSLGSNSGRRSVLLQLLGLVLVVPVIADFGIDGVRGLAGFAGFSLVLSQNKWFKRRLRKYGFQFTSGAYFFAVIGLSLYFVSIPKILYGYEPFRTFLWAVVFVFLASRLAKPSASVLRLLSRSYSGGRLPQTEVPYVVCDSPEGSSSAVSRYFLDYVQRMAIRLGRRDKGVSEKSRYNELEQQKIFDSQISRPSASTRSRERDDGIHEEVNSILNDKGVVKGLVPFLRAAITYSFAVNFERKFRNKGFILIHYQQLADSPQLFRSYVVRHAAGIVTIGEGSESFFKKGLRTLVSYRGEEKDRELEMLHFGARQMTLESPALWRKLSLTQYQWARESPGPWYTVLDSLSGFPESVPGFNPVVVPGIQFWRASARHAADLIAQQAVPSSISAANLSGDSRRVVSELCSRGLAPVADAYLRFRVSESGVERFLNLLDCFEALLKYSYFSELARLGELPHSRAEIPEALGRPSMGHWIFLLKEILGREDQLSSSLASASPIAEYWSGRLQKAPHDLIDAARGVGLAWNGAVPRSHLAWLDWLVWLRNKTKGHGAVIESTVVQLLHQFHQVLADAIGALGSMTFESVLVNTPPGETGPLHAKGCARGPFRMSSVEVGELLPERSVSFASIEHNGAVQVLAPYVAFQGQNCLTWNGMNGERGEYIDYASGRISLLEIPESW